MRRVLGSVLLVVLVACGGEEATPAAEHDTAYEHEVAGDPDAGVADIVAAGRAVDVATSGTGERLVTYLVESDDDEGPQASAWRLYDGADVVTQGAGTRVSEASARPGVWPLADGFLLQPDPGRQRYEVVAADGTSTPAATTRTERPVAPGDVQIGDGSTTVFRPDDATVFPAPDSPAGRRQQGQAVDADGGLWALGPWRDTLPVLHSPDGGTTWERTEIDLPAEAYPLGIAVAADRVVVPVGRYEDDVERLVALQVRGPGGDWAEVPAQVDPDEQWYGAEVAALPDGRVLVSGWDGLAYAVPLDGGAWQPVPTPDDTDGWLVGADGGQLHATNWRQAPAYVSVDLGQTWEVLPR
jgi:hypothetical protein